MEINKINISKIYNLKGNAVLSLINDLEYLDHGKIEKQPAIVICPGGGYGMVSKREGWPVAVDFLSAGFIPFILNYTVGKGFSYPTQLHELLASVDYIRKNADVLGVDKDKIFLIGFSAGGHLVANAGVEYLNYSEKYDAKPNGVCLCYPVISSEYGASGNTYINLLNDYSEIEDLKEKLSFDRVELSMFPPCFIWTTADDNLVSSVNSISFVSKLISSGVKCEFHLYPTGKHGISTGVNLINNNEPYLLKVRTWINLCIDFFNDLN